MNDIRLRWFTTTTGQAEVVRYETRNQHSLDAPVRQAEQFVDNHHKRTLGGPGEGTTVRDDTMSDAGQ